MATQKEPEKGVFHDCSIAFIQSSALSELLISQASLPPLAICRINVANLHLAAERHC